MMTRDDLELIRLDAEMGALGQAWAVETVVDAATQGACERAAARVAQDLRLKAAPAVRWFRFLSGLEQRRLKSTGVLPAGERLVVPDTAFGAFRQDQPATIWLRSGITGRLLVEAIAHESKHVEQFQRQGGEWMAERRGGWVEEDATIYASKARDWLWVEDTRGWYQPHAGLAWE